ncbi:hypothetical protein HMPREF9404_5472 [Eggerthella sp. HGA1]|nr:hypothetical protein HMPREF9404_5472 [Eggerthella sp. HGA1]
MLPPLKRSLIASMMAPSCGRFAQDGNVRSPGGFVQNDESHGFLRQVARWPNAGSQNQPRTSTALRTP